MVAEAPERSDLAPATHAAALSIKILNLLSNRYHAGVVRSHSQGHLALELPQTSRLRPGQRVRFILAQDAGPAVVARRNMRRGLITRVRPASGMLEVELSPARESTAV